METMLAEWSERLLAGRNSACPNKSSKAQQLLVMTLSGLDITILLDHVNKHPEDGVSERPNQHNNH